tara:strand:+ start:741 stop:1259 length:519 start_codon:yes stop_codon:yes gene_type:complete
MPQVNLREILINFEGKKIEQPDVTQVFTKEMLAAGKRPVMEKITLGMCICATLLNNCKKMDFGQDDLAPIRRWMLAQTCSKKMQIGEDGLIELDSKTIGMIRERAESMSTKPEDQEPRMPTDRLVPFSIALDPDLLNNEKLKDVHALLHPGEDEESSEDNPPADPPALLETA